MNNTIIFLSFVLIVLSLMLKINIIAKYEMLENKVYLILKLYGIKILIIKLDVIGLYYEINNNKKLKKLEDVFSIENNYLIGEIKKSILDKLYYARFGLKSAIGVGSSSNTAIIVSSINLLCEKIANYLDEKDIELEYTNESIYENTNIRLSLDILVYFTIFDMVFALITSFYKRGRYVKKAKRRSLTDR